MDADYIRHNLQQSIETMRSFCNTAEHELEEKDNTPEENIRAVIHALLWGLANTNHGISSALAECSRDRERRT